MHRKKSFFIINDTYAEIDRAALKKNFQIIRSLANIDRTAKICSVVKANAYGHGMRDTALFLAKCGTDYLATADYSESITLRKYLRANLKQKKEIPVLCLGILTEPDKFFYEIVKNNIEPTFSDFKIARDFNEFLSSNNLKHPVQVHVDTGMNRVGIPVGDAYETVKKISKLKNLYLKGIYSHFATSEIAGNGFAREQQKKFIELVRQLEASGLRFELKHMENTGGIVNYRNDFFNMVRPGLSLYGYYPDRKKLKKDVALIPVMSLKSKVSMIKKVKKGNSISYGRKFFTKSDTEIASIPVGYGDGYSRLLTNKSQVLIKGKLYRTVGAVCMDWIMIDLGRNSNVRVNDEVIIFGKEYPADNLSEIIGTIPYEVLCNVSTRVQRLYVN